MIENPAGLIVHNVSAVAIRDERFAVFGSDREITRYRVQQTGAVDLKCGDTASSGDLFRNVTSQLAAVFRARGCAVPVAEELAQKVAGEVKARVREVLRQPGLDATWIFGVRL